MKFRITVMLIMLIIIAAMANCHLNQKSEQEAQEAKELLRRQAVRAQVSTISAKHNANTDWAKQLSRGDSLCMSRILTIELEALWKGERPVLYACSVKDISSAGSDSYLVLVEQNSLHADYYFSTELRMSLTAPKEMVDSFLQKNPNLLTDFDFNNGVAIVAKINDIKSTNEHNGTGELVEVKTGKGQLLDLVYIGDTTLME